MKKILLATVALAALAAPAAAADLAARPTYTKAPVLAPVPTWAGFYLGAFGGYATTDNGGVLSPKGGFAGGTIGYNWQSGAWVYGLEADAAWADIKDSVGGVVPGFGAVGIASKIDATGTARGRVGYAFNNVLLYGTGGYAWANNKITLSALGVGVSDTQFLSGWTAGGGVEVLFAPKWSVKAEYLYKSFDGKTYFGGALPTGNLNLHSVQVGVNYHF
ncbi:putative outer-membrane protein, putative secreted protein [Bradyrhizobium sp. ORS 278]|uniref:outer membrane protein n=1 Tax=Bradyrhizobium sp. (strain ORS 278) TaxID=114615 RepID=UPI0001508131|nr:outer membrane beta-barrel protein [Bradyrhizobium sp. ORS 278]CAL77759.1 putative outer-membrane protein, putative secreted protein [Bradyrhizobium sp. ORS 278]